MVKASRDEGASAAVVADGGVIPIAGVGGLTNGGAVTGGDDAGVGLFGCRGGKALGWLFSDDGGLHC